MFNLSHIIKMNILNTLLNAHSFHPLELPFHPPILTSFLHTPSNRNKRTVLESKRLHLFYELAPNNQNRPGDNFPFSSSNPLIPASFFIGEAPMPSDHFIFDGSLDE